MRELNERVGATFVIASHDPTVITAAGRLVRIEDGRITGPGVVYKPRKAVALVCPENRQGLMERFKVKLRRMWGEG